MSNQEQDINMDHINSRSVHDFHNGGAAVEHAFLNLAITDDDTTKDIAVDTKSTYLQYSLPLPPRIFFVPEHARTSSISDRGFIHLGKLPTELRLKIWRLTFPEPRMVSIRKVDNCGYPYVSWEPRCKHFHPSRAEPIETGWNRPLKYWEASSTAPVTLSVCRESRYETLQCYFPLFEGASKISPMYFAPRRDTLTARDYKSATELHKILKKAEGTLGNQLSRVECIAVTERTWYENDFPRDSKPMFHLLKLLSGVKEVIIIEQPDESKFGLLPLSIRLKGYGERALEFKGMADPVGAAIKSVRPLLSFFDISRTRRNDHGQ